jgi:integrase
MIVKTVIRKVKSKTGLKGILYFRIYEKDNVDFRVSTNISVVPEYWDTKNNGYKVDTPQSVISESEREEVNKKIIATMTAIKNTYPKKGGDAKWLTSKLTELNMRGEDTITAKAEHKSEANAQDETKPEVQLEVQPEAPKEKTLLDYFAQYLEEAQFNDWHRQAQTSVMHRLERYEKWIGYNTSNPNFKLYLNDFDKEQVEDYADYMEHESEYYEANPEFYAQFNIRNPKWIRQVSRNSISCGIKRLCMFLNWAVKKDYLKDLSFRNVSCDQQVYGTPYFLTIEERDKVMYFDLRDYPRLERHRDKFIFQCLIGCRSNDLELFTWDHIVGDFLEYIPHKNLLAGRSELVRVPLCDKAKEILECLDPESEYLFRYFSHDLYRQDIKKILKLAGINRLVTVINPITRKAEQVPLCECAATHLARRTFIGNLYKQVKDPALIASLTGHTENSTSFNRYRAIDDDVKRDVLSLIE